MITGRKGDRNERKTKMEEVEKTRFISFRVSDEEYELIERAAKKSGETPNGWSRGIVMIESGNELPMIGVERLLYLELACLRYVVGNGFRLLADGKLTPEEWKLVIENADQKSSEIAGALLSRRQVNVKMNASG
jgi:hypothetical protein